jgi:hypothetical protein
MFGTFTGTATPSQDVPTSKNVPAYPPLGKHNNKNKEDEGKTKA